MNAVVVLMALMVIVVVTVACVTIGEKTGLPWPALTTIVTTALLFLPGMPSVYVPADLILPIFLPPLLWALARRTSWGVIREQWITIIALSVVLVVLTIFAVGAVAYSLIPAVGFAASLVIGAAIAPPDPVAVEAVAKPAGIPRRILSTLQTEGLFNDAASIVAFHMALSVVTTHKAVTPLETIAHFIYAAIIAVIMGLLIARVAAWAVNHVSEVAARNVLFWLVPFVAYVVAEEIHASGVIAVVVAGIEMNSRASIEAEDRLSNTSFWDTVDVMFTGVAFGMIGLTVNNAIQSVGNALWRSVGVGAVLAVTAIVVRFVVLFIVTWIHRARGRASAAPLRMQDVFLITWCGMRGLVTLALVLSAPYDFPARRELAVIALTVLCITMVIPGLLLPLLMKVLTVGRGAEVRAERMRRLIVKRARDAAAQVLQQHYAELDPDVSVAVQHWFEQHIAYSELLDSGSVDRKAQVKAERQLIHEVLREAVQAAQKELLQARKERGINPIIADEVLKEIDRLAMIVDRSYTEAPMPLAPIHSDSL